MNIQRNIFAGLLIFLVFLTIPLYLDFIGIEQSDTNENNILENKSDNAPDISNTTDKKIISLDDSNQPINNGIEKLITINTDYYSMVVSNRSGGSIVFYQITEKDENQKPKYIGSYNQEIYDDSLMVTLIDNPKNQNCTPCIKVGENKLNNIFDINTEETNIILNRGEYKELIFTYKLDSQDYIQNKIILNGNGYSYESEYSYKSNTQNQQSIELIWNGGILPTEMGDADIWEGHSAAYIYHNENLESIIQADNIDVESETFNKNIDWFSIRNKYFSVIMIPQESMDYAKLESKNNDTFENREITPIYSVVLGSETIKPNYSFTTYMGPLDIDHIKLLDESVESIMNFGWSIIKPFSKMILWIIKSLHNTLGLNYGLALIVLGVIMRIVMGPLTKKSAESSAKMQEVAPLQKKIQEKYKDNPQQLQKEMGALWKKHGVNPISGCLPMLLQWPILMSLFIVFRSTVEFRGQPFIFWIKDLSQPDYILDLPFHIPMYGSAIAVLPIIMGISMFLTMGITMQDKSQKPMMYFMNTFFILIFNSFPSALTLYYTVFNFLSYQQQLSIKKNK
tara:strand:+ start:37243 stop:38943 length:1701 start_codon:yes stop_codon:yes gene_type:complete